MKKSTKKVNIAILQTSLTAGGVEKVLVNLLNAFDYSLYNVDLFLFEKGDFFVNQINEKVNIINVFSKTKQKNMTLRELLKKFKIFSAIKLAFFVFISLFYRDKYDKRRVISKSYIGLSKKKYNAAICFNGTSRTLLTNTVFNIRARKRIVWIHGSGYENVPLKLYSFFDKIYCVSQGVKNDFDLFFPSFLDKTSVFYNLLNEKEILLKANIPLNITYKGFIILTVSRLSREKGVLMIPDLVEKLKASYYNFTWLLVGDGPLHQEIVNEIKNKRIENELILLGSLQNPYNYMKMCDLYVQPSLSEGYCTTTNEAKLLCKPILVTNVNGMNEQFINGETATIVDGANIQSLFIGIEKMMNDTNYRESLSRNLKSNDYFNINNDFDSFLSYIKFSE